MGGEERDEEKARVALNNESECSHEAYFSLPLIWREDERRERNRERETGT